jgi:predicted nucleic acid-binding protein
VLAAQVIREYLAVATRPVSANGLGLALADSLENVRELRARVRLLPEERPVLPTFLALLASAPATGARVHDAHLVATAMVHGVHTIVSLNGDDLRPFAGSRVVVLTPAEALGARGGRRRPG